MVTQDKLDEALLYLTGLDEWNTLCLSLKNEIYAAQARSLDVGSWEEVNQLRGYAQALAFIINLRDNTKMGMKQDEQDSA